MKIIAVILLILASSPIKAQKFDPRFYLLGFSFDYTVPTYPKIKLEESRFDPWIHESDTGKVLRLSEITDLKYVKRKAKKDCSNCNEFYRLKNIPRSWKLNEFYDFEHEKEKGTKPGKVTGFFKSEILENATSLQIKSFLAGLYLGFGSFKGDTVLIQFDLENKKLKLTKDFIDKINGASFLKVIPAEKGMIGGVTTLIFVPNSNLRVLLLEENKRKNTLTNRSYKL